MPGQFKFPPRSRTRVGLATKVVFLLGVFLFIFSGKRGDSRCSTPQEGYRCHQELARSWGAYSPFFSLEETSEYLPGMPAGCAVTFAQVLSRHGSRHPTLKKGIAYRELVRRIRRQIRSPGFGPGFEFLGTFDTSFVAGNLSDFGKLEMTQSGKRFFERYQNLAAKSVPFTRAAGSDRVIESAIRFLEGFLESKEDGAPPGVGTISPSLIIPEGPGSNNTLEHGLCGAFEDSPSENTDKNRFLEQFFTGTLQRMKANLPGVSLDLEDVVDSMDLCPFHTVVATPEARELSPFCQLFTKEEWKAYDYYGAISKYYAHGNGNPLGPANGIGFVNELIARLTNQPVNDSTSVNHTLDDNPETFPLDLPLYADFSHDNTMVSIFAALGLHNITVPFNKIISPLELDGYSASWTVPFAGRMYVEKMHCGFEDLVRILINERVVTPAGCRADAWGRCKLSEFVDGLQYARSGGNWEHCSKTSVGDRVRR